MTVTDPVQELVAQLADEIEGLFGFLESHHHSTVRLAELVAKARVIQREAAGTIAAQREKPKDEMPSD